MAMGGRGHCLQSDHRRNRLVVATISRLLGSSSLTNRKIQKQDPKSPSPFMRIETLQSEGYNQNKTYL